MEKIVITKELKMLPVTDLAKCVKEINNYRFTLYCMRETNRRRRVEARRRAEEQRENRCEQGKEAEV